MITVFKRLTLL